MGRRRLRELARHRAANISDLRYRLSFDLFPGAARIKGREEIRLKLKNAADPVILDFRDLDEQGRIVEGVVSNVTVNGSAVNDLRQTGGHIILPARHFKIGENKITMDFETGVAPANRPIIRYQDRDDGGEYIYTLFVPMDASLAFPCFDQPDLKARFTLTTAVPTAWTVVTNTRARQSLATVRTHFGSSMRHIRSARTCLRSPRGHSKRLRARAVRFRCGCSSANRSCSARRRSGLKSNG